MGFFDVRVFRYLTKTYELFMQKRMLYNELIIEIGHESFTLLVMAAIGGMVSRMQKVLLALS